MRKRDAQYSMNCFVEAVASVWVSLVWRVNKNALGDDMVTCAREQLQDALHRVEAQQGAYVKQLLKVTTKVRENATRLGKPELRKLLLSSRRLKMQQRSLDDKARVMEGQLSALDNNEFNKVVLSTLQTSAKALQKMGLNKDLQSTDQVISDLEEGLQYSSDVGQALSANLGSDATLDDIELDAELNEILGLQHSEPVFDTATTAKPAEQNSMSSVSLTIIEEEKAPPVPEEPAQVPGA